ncbi:MAG TPA: sigma-54 dependent transcriptional regulator [Burkholderiales bacterium]|nr:sigma-54 dependent transcriptional regulator [Burkholderiales bacterium]
MANILVVDDEVGIRELLSEILVDEGHSVRVAENAGAARELRNRERPDLVLLDIWMPDIDGISLLKEWSAAGQLSMPVVMMSGHATIDTAVEATRIGAMDFLEKPIAMQKLLATVKRALRSGEPTQLTRLSLANLGRSTVINDLRRRLNQYAQSSAPLLLRGEPGVMPELYARHLQQPGMPFVNAGAALAETPQELLNQAAGGILFIEELGALSKPQQKGVAFVAQRLEKHKVRLVTFTSDDNIRLLEEKGFDGELLAQLSQLVLMLPSLREHAEDVPDLASMLLTQLVEARVCPSRSFSVAALNLLRNHVWPRNIDELQQAVHSAAMAALDDEIGPQDVQMVLPPANPLMEVGVVGELLEMPLREAREAFEKIYFEHHLSREASMSRLADRSGLERTHLYRKLKSLGIQIKKED